LWKETIKIVNMEALWKCDSYERSSQNPACIQLHL